MFDLRNPRSIVKLFSVVAAVALSQSLIGCSLNVAAGDDAQGLSYRDSLVVAIGTYGDVNRRIAGACDSDLSSRGCADAVSEYKRAVEDLAVNVNKVPPPSYLVSLDAELDPVVDDLLTAARQAQNGQRLDSDDLFATASEDIARNHEALQRLGERIFAVSPPR